MTLRLGHQGQAAPALNPSLWVKPVLGHEDTQVPWEVLSEDQSPSAHRKLHLDRHMSDPSWEQSHQHQPTS